MDRNALPIVGRSQAYLVLVGVVVGMLVAGLAVPMVFGESVQSTGGQAAAAEFSLPEEGTTDTTLAAAGGAATAVTTPGATTATTAAAAVAGGSTSAGAAATGGSGPSGPLTASDVGVTPTSIRLGAVLLDIATVGRLGVAVAIDPEQQRKAFQAFADEINSHGGINGRKIEMHYRTFDVTDRNDQIAACRELTQEKKVFAVLGGFNTVDPNVCVVEENRTPLIASSSNNPDWMFARGGGRLISFYPRSGRMMAGLVSELERVKLAGKKIGILSDGLNDPGGQVAKNLEQLLKERGHNVVYRGQFSDDIPTASSQVPVEVNRMQTSGAEVVLMLNSNAVYGTQFVNQATGQAYRPQYVTTDWASGNGDSTNQNMPSSFEGALSFTYSRTLSSKRGLPPLAEANRCRQIYEQFSKTKLAAPGNAEYGLSVQYCDVMKLVEVLGTKAGSNLTRVAFTNARSQVPSFVSASWSPGSLGAKADVADGIRTQRWTASCKCWSPADGFHRPGG